MTRKTPTPRDPAEARLPASHKAAIRITERLLGDLHRAQELYDVDAAVIGAVRKFDEEAGLLGDSEMALLAAESLQRRGKPISWLTSMAETAIHVRKSFIASHGSERWLRQPKAGRPPEGPRSLGPGAPAGRTGAQRRRPAE